MPEVGHFIPYLGSAMGGPVYGMAAYVALLARSGCPVTVFTVLNGADGESVRLDSWVRLIQEAASAWGGFRRSAGLWRQARDARIDLIHSHCLWTDVNRLAGHLARHRRLPHLLAPCGMLAPGALRHHGWKKIPIRLWFQDRALREAQCLHAKSHKEYEDIRRFGLRNPVAIIPNPIAMPPGREERGDGRSEREGNGRQRSDVRGQRSVAGGPVVRGPWSSGQWTRSPSSLGPVVYPPRTVLFLGRLHPVKALARLLQA
ncbi:MAG: glycosyltransferase, partial [bacterium]